MVSNTVQHFISVTPIHVFGFITHSQSKLRLSQWQKLRLLLFPEDGGSRFLENVGELLATTWLYIK